MKNFKNIFRSLLLIALAFFLTGCAVAHFEKNVDHEEYIEIEETVCETTESSLLTETELTIETLPVEKQYNAFDKDITYEISYVDEGEVMPYALFTPSSADDDISIPLIVWLHDRNEHNLSEEEFIKKGFAGIISNWNLENFNAYIIYPQMKGSYYSEYWCNPNTKSHLTSLLDKFIAEHNINKDKIIVAGARLGAQGALYMSVEMVEYFDRAVIFSGYSCGIQCSEIEIPVNGFLATYSELEEVSYFMNYHFSPLKNCKLQEIKTNRYDLLEVVLNLDRKSNGKSDIVEWMLSDISE